MRDALYNDPQARTPSLRSLLRKRVTLQSSVAGSILTGLKNQKWNIFGFQMTIF